MKMSINERKSYSKLITLDSFDDRFKYLTLGGLIGVETFGSKRYLNQDFYRTKIWRDFRNHIIVRDNGCDLGHPDHLLKEPVYIHHINPITIEELMDDLINVLNEDNVITTSFATHQAIHYGSSEYLQSITFADRTPNDTCPWRKKEDNYDLLRKYC